MFHARQVTCTCNHLTSFSVLIVPETKGSSRLSLAAQEQALSIITYVGLAVSIVCLILTLGAFALLRHTKFFTFRQQITVNQVIALLLAQLIFAAGIQATSDPSTCEAVAALLHYLWLVVLFWTAAEAHHIYMNFVKVMGAGASEQTRFRWYMGLSWLGALLIMLLSVATSIDDYGSADVCWIRAESDLIWAFLVPMMAVMIFNLVVVITASCSVASHHGQGLAWKTFGMFVLLLGLGWLVGLLMLAWPREAALHYLFAIINSLQGMFIFMIQVVLGFDRRQTLLLSLGLCSHADTADHGGTKTTSNSTDEQSRPQTASSQSYLVVIEKSSTANEAWKLDLDARQPSRGSIYNQQDETRRMTMEKWQGLVEAMDHEASSADPHRPARSDRGLNSRQHSTYSHASSVA
eukprot:TRINITY_DN11695_c0_g1_i3.p1 TRINITY_DN11695_c0_g1~~TRINITY_DN11695_c0_g1_i3.p1  ORF type:complete len:407 (+),score=83.53 TRINITY_DN11695_c0_g1_i3:213-1433(+)